MEDQFRLQQLSTEKFPLSFDDSTMLSVEFVNFNYPFISEVIGMQQNNFIIIKTPENLSGKKNPQELIDSTLLVKYIHAGRKIVFKTRVLEAINRPVPLLFLAYPSSIRFHELRKVKRTLIMVPCTLHTRDVEEYYGMLTDLSLRGSLCQIRDKGNPSLCYIEKENPAGLRCLLPGLKDEQRVNGIIRNIRTEKDTTKIGIEFVDMSEQVSSVIEKYLYTVQKSRK